MWQSYFNLFSSVFPAQEGHHQTAVSPKRAPQTRVVGGAVPQVTATMGGSDDDFFHRHSIPRTTSSRRSPYFNSCAIILGYIFLCSLCVSPVDCTLRFFGQSRTFARFPKWNACSNDSSISFEFKTRQANGLLMFTDDNNRYDYLQVSRCDWEFLGCSGEREGRYDWNLRLGSMA